MEVMCVNKTWAIIMDCGMWAHTMDCGLTNMSLTHCKHMSGYMLSLPPHFFRAYTWVILSIWILVRCSGWPVPTNATGGCLTALLCSVCDNVFQGWACRHNQHMNSVEPAAASTSKTDMCIKHWTSKNIKQQQLFTLARQIIMICEYKMDHIDKQIVSLPPLCPIYFIF